MLETVFGKKDELSPGIYEKIGLYRNEVFVSRLGWKLHSIQGMEWDEFDSPDAVYVVSLDSVSRVNGVARLLPTTGPYLLREVFPAVWGMGPLPNSTEVWELSRFAAVESSAIASETYQATAEHMADFLCRVLEIAGEYGASTLISVSPVGMKRLLYLKGFSVTQTGPIVSDASGPIVSLSIGCHEFSSRASKYFRSKRMGSSGESQKDELIQSHICSEKSESCFMVQEFLL